MGINKVQINRNGQTETIIDLTQDTVTEETLLDGVIAHGADGEPIIGTFAPKLQDKTITENGTYQADNGYDGLGSVTVEVASGGTSGGEEMAIRFPGFIKNDVLLMRIYDECEIQNIILEGELM